MLKYFTDKNVTKAVAEQLRRNGIDCIPCEDVGMAKASDPEILEYATKEKRAVISFDQDMPALHKKWLGAGKSHAGIVFLQPHLQGQEGIGKVVKKLMELHPLDSLADQLKFIS